MAGVDSMEKTAEMLAGVAADQEDSVAEMLERLNLTSEEADVVTLEDENEEDLVSLNWALIGKVLSPNVLHIQTIMSALRPAWGNPKGLVAKPVGDNVFIVEFESKSDRDRIKEGASWTVGKHAVILNDFDPGQKPSEVSFDRIMLWARIYNLRFELMNKLWGESLGARIGKVEKVDVDSQGRAWGNALRVRVSVNITKPLMRVVSAYSKKNKEYEIYEVKYERLPHYCFSCGIIGHSSLECPTPGVRDAEGKLPYNTDKLCVKEEKKKNFSMSKSGQSSQSGGRSSRHDDKHGDSQSNERGTSGEGRTDFNGTQEVKSPMKPKEQISKQNMSMVVDRDLFPLQKDDARLAGQKRKEIKVYKPKGQGHIQEEKVLPTTPSLALIPARQKQTNSYPSQALQQSEDEQASSHKKMRKETSTPTSRSADQAEAATEQPCHTQ
uniref:Uncharacterized protein n=1 Tax=Avena sativa TaxID=4498 RepID=A0ACD5Z614_AVESA